MKRVSFEVAKALKEAGYPQGDKNSGNCDVYPLEDHDDNYTPYTRVGKITTRYKCETWRTLSSIPYVVAPYYLEVWLWLWREKKCYIDVLNNQGGKVAQCLIWIGNKPVHKLAYDTPEEAIIAAIDAALEYLSKNKK